MNEIRFEVDSRGVATLTLNRPEVRNAMNGELMSQMAETIGNLPSDVRVLVLAGEGKVFSSGADLAWMMSATEAGGDSAVLLSLFSAVDQCRAPVVARVQGAAMAGAAGLVACCDFAVAAEDAVFGFTEVRLGLVPAVISPYILRKTGYSFARAAFLTGERFDARRAYEVGLVHRIVPSDQLDAAVEEVVRSLLLAGPEAIGEVRKLIEKIWGRSPSEVSDVTVAAISERRASEEGREGITAFLEKRRPRWAQPPD